MNQIQRNILEVFDGGDEELRKKGMDWYANLHYEILDNYHERIGIYGLEKSRSCPPAQPNFGLQELVACYAIGSPQVPWRRVVGCMDKYLFSGSRADLQGLLPHAKEKICGLYEGRLSVTQAVRGLKTRAFFENLLHPRMSQQVTIDRHAYRLAYRNRNTGDLSDPRVYERVAEHYRLVAAQLGMLPLELQAATWCLWRGRVD
jgi:hypothetical protein